jgi:hypothetical protein
VERCDVHVVTAPDKFRGTATAAEVAAAVGRAVEAAGGTCDRVPVADGGEGTLDVLGGANRTTVVSGPLGDEVSAGWRYGGRTAIVEMARASGLELVGGPEANDAMAASTYGTGELIGAAIDAGCRRIIVGVGGSATVDGGLGALRALEPLSRLRAVELVVACDVRTRFVDAARTFAPQKGASPAQVELLHRRLARLVQVYERTYGIDVSGLDGGGAAGGLPGGWRWPVPASSPASTSSPTRWTCTTGWRAQTSSSPARASSTSRASRARSSAGCATSPARPGARPRSRRRGARRRRAPDGLEVVSLTPRWATSGRAATPQQRSRRSSAAPPPLLSASHVRPCSCGRDAEVVCC